MPVGPEATLRSPSNLTFLQASLEEAPEWILAFDSNFRYLLWNRAMERISGVKRDQVLGQVAFEVFPFLLEIGEDEYFRAALQGERVRSQARAFAVEGGNSGLFDAEYIPIREESGKIIGGLGYIRDRSAQIQEQQIRSELNLRENSLSTLLQSAETISAELDLEKVVQHATDAATKLAGAEFGAFFYNVENERGESYMLYTISGVPREVFSKFPMPRNTAVFAPTFSGEGIVRSADITKDSRYGHNSPRQGMPEGHLPVRSYLAVPVKSRTGEVFGGLFFGHSGTDKFTEMSERMVSAIAEAGIAIENSRLYEAERRARGRAQESESKISAIWSSMSDGFVSLDGSWKFQYANEKACELLKSTPSDLIGQTIWETFPEVQSTLLEKELRFAAETQSARHFENYFAPYKTWFEFHIYPAHEAVSIYFRDVTTEKKSAAEIQKIEDRLKLITTTTDIGTWYCDLPFDVLEWSTKTKEHFWLPADARVTIDTFYERIHPEDRERTRQAIELSIADKALYDIDYRTISMDGQIKWIRAIGRGFYDAEQPTRFDGVTVDQTARRKAEDTLRRTERLATAGRLAATVAHEVNNPLETVTNLLFLCQTDPKATEQIRSRLKLADEELRRVAHIVRQTLGFYRDTSIRRDTNFSQLILDVVDLFKKRFYDKGVTLTANVGDSIHAFIMPDGIRQVVANFLSNALDACSSGAEVILSVKNVEDQVIFEISDTGSGIKPQNLAHLFEPFFTTKSDVGTGLGLWVSNSIIEKHGGKISVQTNTDPQRHGTTFSIAVPTTIAVQS